MGRRTLAAERTEQIFQAFVRCVARHGVAGTTLELVAKEAGLARGHMRHYVGNRDALDRLFYDRMVERFVKGAEQLINATPPGKKAQAMMLELLTPEEQDDPLSQAIDALLDAARLDTSIRKQVYSVYSAMESTLARALESDYPGRPISLYRNTAYQLLALMYGHWSLAGFGFPGDRRAGAVQRAIDIIESVADAPLQASRRSV